MRNAQLAGELEEVVTALQHAGVPVIVLKGGALAWTVYADPALRPMTDLDLLVRPEQMAQAGAALAAAGFALSGPAADPPLPFRQRFGGGLDWQRDRHGRTTRLDVQHHLVGVDFLRSAFPVDTDALWEAALPLPLGVLGTHALRLSPDDMLLHLCLHPALHDGYAGPLLWYTDMDLVIRACAADGQGHATSPASWTPASWTRFLERAARFRVRTVAAYGLLTARRLLGTPVPDPVITALAPGLLRHGSLRLALLRRLVPLNAETVLHGTPKPSGLRQLLLHAALMDRPRDAVGMAREILFPSAEWLTVRYALSSPAQVRRERLRHPLRVARAMLRALRRPLTQSGLD